MEGIHADWLQEILTNHVSELVAIGVPKTKWKKSDKFDSLSLAKKLRVGSIRTRLHKGVGGFSALNANVTQIY